MFDQPGRHRDDASLVTVAGDAGDVASAASVVEDPETVPETARECAAALREAFADERRAVARRLATVAHWADLHSETAAATVRAGDSHGTPSVTSFAATELGVLLEVTTGSARNLLRDVLDLRHRHPLLWRALLAGEVAEWVARRVVHATAEAELTVEQARRVDEWTARPVCRLPFGRAMALVAARIVQVDPEAADERRRAVLQRRRVTLGGTNSFGLRTMTAHANGADLARVDAMLDVLARAMADRGDADSHEVLRAKAMGLLANPAVACTLLAVTGADDGLAPTAAAPSDPGDAISQESAVRLAAELGRTLLELGPTALDRLRPTSVLHYHLAAEALGGGRLRTSGEHPPNGGPHRGVPSCAVARSERDGPLTLPQLREWLEGEQVVVKPVLDPAGVPPVDAYEVPDRMRDALVLLRPFEVFPWGTLPSRIADADHTVPWLSPARGGPPGQTQLANLGPLGRGHHNAKTLGGWQLHQPARDEYFWRTPTGHWSRVDASGTVYLGTQRPTALRQAPLSPGEVVVTGRLDSPALTG